MIARVMVVPDAPTLKKEIQVSSQVRRQPMQTAGLLSVVVGKTTTLAALHKLIGSKVLPLPLLHQL